MKPLNYLRVLAWFLASVLIDVWRFGWWCIAKAVVVVAFMWFRANSGPVAFYRQHAEETQ